MKQPKRQYSIEQLQNGQWVCRPAGQLGIIGWHPYPWTAAFGATPSEALDKFKTMHPEEKPHAL